MSSNAVKIDFAVWIASKQKYSNKILGKASKLVKFQENQFSGSIERIITFEEEKTYC